MKNINIPQEMIDKATRLSSIKGNTKNFEQVLEMLLDEAAKKAKKHSKDASKWAQRTAVENTPVSNKTIAEINRENALKNLPSSMR